MRLIRTLDQAGCAGPSIVSVGNFDGVHRGHAILLREVVLRARSLNACSVIITFDPHTRAVIEPQNPPGILTSISEKTVLMENFGIDCLVCLSFTEELRALPPEKFVSDVLINRFRAIEWIMGEGHTFGRNQSGDKDFLLKGVTKKHFNAFAAELVSHQGSIVSSTAIRGKIAEGNIAEAAQMLGHSYLIVAKRITGEGRGRTLGYPTLNFSSDIPNKVLPPAGVYAAELEFGDFKQAGALYFGKCPTFGTHESRFEFFSFGDVVNAPSPGNEGRLWVHRFIRADRVFESAEALVEQIKIDIHTIQHFFS